MGGAKDQIYFFLICAWRVNLFHRFLCLDDLDNLLLFVLFTFAVFCIKGLESLGICTLFSYSPQRTPQERGNKMQLLFQCF